MEEKIINRVWDKNGENCYLEGILLTLLKIGKNNFYYFLFFKHKNN